MSNSLFVQANSWGYNDDSTHFVHLVGCSVNNITSVALSEIPIRNAGVFSNLFVYAPTNTASVNSPVTLQKNRVDTALTITYAADQTGAKEDTSNTVTFAATDKANWEITIPAETGTNTLTLTVMSLQFAPETTTNCVVVLGATGNTNTSLASVTRYYPPNGPSATNNTEARVNYRIRATLTARNLYTYASVNARTTDVVFTTRKNSAAGGQSVTYTSGQTGAKEDTSGTDSLVAGNDYCYAITTLAGTESMNVQVVSTSLVSTADVFPLLAGYHATRPVGPSATIYWPVSGGIETSSTTEADEQILPRFTFTASELGTRVETNTNASLACVVTVRDNGADSAVTVSYNAAQTGLKNDSVNTTKITSGVDEIDYQAVNNDASGTVTFFWVGMLGTVVTNAELFSRLSKNKLAWAGYRM